MIFISWQAPVSNSGQEMCIDSYYVQYTLGSEYTLIETTETNIKLSLLHVPPFTFTCFKIRAEYRGRLGPEVYIGCSTGKKGLHGKSTF